jgi:Zn-dependent protease/CBS domain-containing protein
MSGGILVAKIKNIPIRLHFSWFIIFMLVAWSLASGYFPIEYPNLSTPVYWLLGGVTSLLFGVSVLAHELGHSFMAMRYQVPVKSVTLFIFGGIAQIEEEPKSPGAEFWIAIAGPLTSLALGLLFGGLWLLDRPLAVLSAPSIWLARINLILAFFNLIPGFPLDGGRVLRSIVWKINKDLKKATRIAAVAGQIVAFGFIAVGIFTLFSGNFFNGLWLAFIGWFLQNAAASAVSHATIQETLKGVTVSEVMQTDLRSIPWHTRLDCVIEEQVIPFGSRIFLVMDNSGIALRGLLTLRSVTAVPRERWPDLTAQDVMIPRAKFVAVGPDMDLIDALRIMDDANVAQVPVMEQEKVVGILSREEITHYLRLRSEIGL